MKRVRITLGQRQAHALLTAALIGIEDLKEYDDPEVRQTARLADASLDRLAASMKKAEA
jgi:capsid protein